MEALTFFIYALIVFVLCLLLGGTMIGYFFQKKYEYEMKKYSLIGKAISSGKAAKKDEKSG